jgi:hypothetical protein
VGLLYDVSDFTGFHRSQVKVHADLFTRLGDKVTGLALVGARPVVRFGAVTVGLMANTPLKTFDTNAEALAWLGALRRLALSRCRTRWGPCTSTRRRPGSPRSPGR